MYKTIKGITWDHSRAFPPLVAVSQRYEELNPGVRIRWEKRTLDEFGHKPIDLLSEEYDLIVIDHPWAGYCFERKLVLDLRSRFSDAQWCQLADAFVGESFRSYFYDEKLLAIPIDAATPAASWRPDLLRLKNISVPETWEELIRLADQKQVVMPGFGADLFLNWLMLLHALKAHPFQSTESLAGREEAVEAMSMLKRLSEPMPDEIFQWNPIRIAEVMTREDQFAYCPFAYSYGNYCRPSFTNQPLEYGDLVRLGGKRLRSILGGTGIAISASCVEIDVAVDFTLYCASSQVQNNIYTYAGGQPAHKEVWQAGNLEDFTGRFFTDSRNAHENAIVRPRYDGYVALQEKAGKPLQAFVKGELSDEKAWNKIEEYYLESVSGYKGADIIL